MKRRLIFVKKLILNVGIFAAILFSVLTVEAVQKAKIVSPEVEVYTGADFDAEILDVVRGGETYLISNKVTGPFYKIKLKNGKIGYIPDTEVDIEGKGRVGTGEDTDDPFLQEMDPIGKDKKKNKNSNKKNKKSNEDDEEADEENTDLDYQGVTLQLINLHEDTLGGVQIDDLTAIGYKKISNELSWEIMGSFKTPKYYEDKLKASVKAYNIWADFGIMNDVPLRSRLFARYGGALFTHASWVKVETAQKKYDMQDVTVGVLLEGGFFVTFKKWTLDLSMKYFFDRNSYGGLGLSFLF